MPYRLFKRNICKKGKPLLSKKWYWEYKLPEETTYTRKCTGYVDKAVAQEYCRKTFRELEQERQGLIPSRQVRDGLKKTIEDHLNDFIADRACIGRSKKALNELKNRVLTLAKECHWTSIQNISSDAFIKWRNKQNLKPKTLNNYRDSLGALCNWLERKGKISRNPFKGVEKIPVIEQNHRQAFTPEEVTRLLNISGKRKVLYLVALTTGLRRGELRQLEWRDVFFDTPIPHLKVRASTTKNKKEALQNLVEPALSELKKLYSPDINPSQKVFEEHMQPKRFFKYDLQAAGLYSLKNEKGLRDFHSLRATFITWGQIAGVSQRVMMDLARHSDRKLTDRIYTDTRLLPTSEALQKIDFPGLLKTCTEKCTENCTESYVPQNTAKSRSVQELTDLEKWQIIENERFSHAKSHKITVNTDGGEALRGQDLNLQPLI